MSKLGIEFSLAEMAKAVSISGLCLLGVLLLMGSVRLGPWLCVHVPSIDVCFVGHTRV